MNAIEIYKAQENIVKEKCAECKTRLGAVSAEKATERKALHIELGMYNLCLRAGLFDRGGTAPDHAETALAHRNTFIPKIIVKYPKLAEIFATLGKGEKEIFISAVQAELYMRDQIYKNYICELEAAAASGDEASVFELKIKTGALESVFAAWEEWRKETGIYSGVFTEVQI